MKVNKTLLFYFLLSCQLFFLKETRAQRVKENFNRNWSFILDSTNDYSQLTTAPTNWRSLNLPHDWSIEFAFDSTSPTGTGGGALRGGVGWYSKSFTIKEALKNKQVNIDFDGVYRNCRVWINGHFLGLRPYGFSTFRYNLSPYLKYGTGQNLILVKVDNSKQPNSRWYSGSGIYRNVWLVSTDKIAIDHWGTFITTPQVNTSSATIQLKANIRNSGAAQKNIAITNIIYDATGKLITQQTTHGIFLKDTVTEINQQIQLQLPKLWSVENPYLYKVVTQVNNNGIITDEYSTSIGIRTFKFDADKGFILNGKPIKINGVCNHHDLGCLGTAINTRALQRQLEILKAMGCNGIRTSHNPPAPELLDLCDSMGFIVMDEAFDLWKKPKNPFDYHLDWDQWHRRDLEDLLRRDRNHPSVFIWSIGNEIPEQWDSTGITIAKELAGIIKALDATRPITAALNDPQPNNNIYKSGVLDLVGFNYHHQQFGNFKKLFPGKLFIGTETVSALETRGHYDLLPSDSLRRWPTQWDKPLLTGNIDLTVNAYDNVSAPWGSTHEETWKEIKKYGFASGQYIWTGFDYIGEPTPYPWPARSAYFGIIDLAGFPKDVYYMYQSEWTNTPVLHLLPHWNWKQGDTVDVWAYYNNADEVELYVNDKSAGIKKKTGDMLHVMWRLPFEAGILKAISRKNGQIMLTKTVSTAGPAYQIQLVADRQTIYSGGDDLSYITVKVLDKNGHLVPDAANLIQFEVTGAGSLAAVDNGNPVSMESFKGNQRKAFNGLCLVVIRSGDASGELVLKASAAGMPSAQLIILSK